MDQRFDFSQPQRQPTAGLLVALANALLGALKNLWPLIIIMIIRGGKPGKIETYEIIGLVALVFILVQALIKFFFSSFHLTEGQFIYNIGGFKRETKILPFEKIQSIHIEQGPLHTMLDIVKLEIDTAGSKEAEVKIDAMKRPMAEALRAQILNATRKDLEEIKEPVYSPPLIELDSKDILRIGLTANHLEVLGIIFLFISNLREALDFEKATENEPEFAASTVVVLIIGTLLILVLLSIARNFFTYHGLTVREGDRGLAIKSGVVTVKDRTLSRARVQYVSWSSSWLRKLAGIRMFRFHSAGNDELRKKERIIIPLTRIEDLQKLSSYYGAQPLKEKEPLRMHPSFILRRLLFLGIIPGAVLAFLLSLDSWKIAPFAIILPLFIWFVAYMAHKKFRVWADSDMIMIRRGFLGESFTLLNWNKIQSVRIRQSIFQKRKGLSSISIITAGGSIRFNFIDINEARAIANYALYVIEKRELRSDLAGNPDDDELIVEDHSDVRPGSSPAEA